MTIAYPSLIQLLSNKFTPFPMDELYSMIEALTKRVQFPQQKLFVLDVSKRSGHSNAYFYGVFRSKRIVLFDTLLEHLSKDETCAILGKNHINNYSVEHEVVWFFLFPYLTSGIIFLAYELGRWNYNHTFALLVGSLSEIFLAFFLFSRMINTRGLFASFGFTNSTPTLVGYFQFEYLYLPISKTAGFLRNTVSRYYEFLTNALACDLGCAASLSSGLFKLQLKNLGNMNPDWLYSMYH
jgi:STE24 endopeptidase